VTAAHSSTPACRAVSLPESATNGNKRSILLLICAVLIIAIAGLYYLEARRGPLALSPQRLVQLTSGASLTTDPAISPDGSLLAYASDRGGRGNLNIWIQPLRRAEPLRLTDHEADDREPSFSPDGGKIVFRSEKDGGGIYVVSALGGMARLIA